MLSKASALEINNFQFLELWTKKTLIAASTTVERSFFYYSFISDLFKVDRNIIIMVHLYNVSIALLLKQSN